MNFNIEEELSVGQNYAVMKLRGMIYHCDTSTVGHFTSIVIDAGGKMWHHDGIFFSHASDAKLIPETHLKHLIKNA
jgi:hypothetical protein